MKPVQTAKVTLGSIRDVILTRYPSIIAQAFSYFERQEHPVLRMQALVQGIFQHTMKYLALMALSEYCEQATPDSRINEAVMELQRPQYGHWTQLLRACDSFFASHSPSHIPELKTIYRPSKHKKLKIKVLLERMVNVKNKGVSHGAGPQQAENEAGEMLAKLVPQVLLWLDELSWICDYPLYLRLSDGTRWKLQGLSPSLVTTKIPDAVDAELFFARSGSSLAAFPLFFFLDQNTTTPDLFLFEGTASGKLVVYLSHSSRHQENSPAVVSHLKERLNRKLIQFKETHGDLSAEGLVDAGRAQVTAKLKALTKEGRWSEELFVSRDDPEGAFRHWLEGEPPGLLIVGEAGSGKSMNLYAWAKQLIESGTPAALFEGREITDATPGKFKERVCAALHRPEALETVLDVLGDANSRLVVLVDAVEECPHPRELLVSTLDLLSNLAASPLRVVLSLRDVGLQVLADTVGPAIDGARERKLLALFPGEDENAPWRAYYSLKRITAQEQEAFFDRYRAHYHIPTTLGELDEITQATLRNPLLLRLACEAFRGRAIPARISPHHLFAELLKRKLTNPVTRKTDMECSNFLNRFVSLLFQARESQLDIAVLYEDPQTRTAMVNHDLNSPYNRLAQAGILASLQEEDDCFGSKTWVRVSFDLLLEVLLLRHLGSTHQPKETALLLRAKPVYAPLAGVLTLQLLHAGERGLTAPFLELVEDLADSDVRGSVSRALENLCYTAPASVPAAARTLAGAGTVEALRCAVDLVRFCRSAGLWDVAKCLYPLIVASSDASRPELATALTDLDLEYANLLFSIGEYPGSIELASRYLEHPNHDVAARAWVTRVLASEQTIESRLYVEMVEQCRLSAEAAGDMDLVAFAIWSKGSVLEDSMAGSVQAIAQYEQIFEIERQLEAKGRTLAMKPYCADLAPVYRWYGRALAEIPDRVCEAERYFRKALELDEAARRFYLISADWNNLAYYYLNRGELEKALDLSSKELSQIHLFQNDPEWASGYFIRAGIELCLAVKEPESRAKHLSEARRCAQESIRIGESPGGHANYLHLSYLAAVSIALVEEKIEEAKATVERLLDHVSHLSEPVPGKVLVATLAKLAVDLFEGTATSEDIDRQVRGCLEAELPVDVCGHLWLTMIPLLLRREETPGLDDLLQALHDLAKKVGNVFWISATRRRGPHGDFPKEAS